MASMGVDAPASCPWWLASRFRLGEVKRLLREWWNSNVDRGPQWGSDGYDMRSAASLGPLYAGAGNLGSRAQCP